ncbi:hypothetical protein FHP29_05295 [Nocardioides albidus]|uniref:Glycosyltransferase family 4 protein n=1 Tax=Nocardioides albidus TaxID=1517589 RepID=A0A5C4W7A9_9ACTN|nr:hypothetical protein [Nocardioides albidus]TNM44127.1 hypothetical protein FHP29_05295 [Nocardioides albidus]
MPVTVLVDPDHAGHHFQAVANVGAVARRSGPVVLLTSVGASRTPSFGTFLAGGDVEVREVFAERQVPTETMIEEIVRVCRSEDVATVVLMDADQALKRWWLKAPRAFGDVRRPRVVFMLTRYPARARITDPWLWRLKAPKALLVAISRANRSVDRVAGFAGRDDMSAGWLVKRTRDPDLCSAHAADSDALRARHGLPLDRQLVGIFGVLSERRNIPLIWEAMQRSGAEADLLLAGAQDPDVRAWVDATAREHPGRLHCFDDFLPNETIDELVAACDVAPIALTNNGPSGIMGKAIAAGVPVVTAGSVVRAREIEASGCGLTADLTAESLGTAIRAALERRTPWENRLPPATAEEFARNLLGVDENGLLPQ